MDNRVVIVTGGGRGIGYGLAEAFLKRGAKVCIADCNVEEGEIAAKELRRKYGDSRTFFVCCDVTSQKDLEEMFALVKSKYKRLDIVCNNAGIGGLDGETQWEKMIDINLKAVIRGTQLAIGYMRKDKGGDGGIVMNTASIVAFQFFAVVPHYTATKCGIVGYTRCLAMDKELAENGMTFLLLCPSVVDTQLPKGFPSEIIDTVKLTDGFLSPEELANYAMQLFEPGVESGSALIARKKQGATFHKFEDI